MSTGMWLYFAGAMGLMVLGPVIIKAVVKWLYDNLWA